MSNLAPIVLFVYNRPFHTERTLEALRNNKLGSVSKLYIYSDGFKSNASKEDVIKIQEVRKIIKKENWCAEVEYIISEKNKGLALSIKEGVTTVVKKHGKVIVMEDDLVTSHTFLTYMNKALEYYENRKSVFSISAFAYPPSKFKIPENYKYDVFVSLRNFSWGWGTWIDRWEQIDWEVVHYKHLTDSMKNALNRGGDDVYELLEGQQTGKLNIWSIQFTIAHFINHAVSIAPCISFVDNVGLDGTGENCSANVSLKNDTLNKKEEFKFLDVLYEDAQIINAFYNVNCRRKRSIWKKGINTIFRLIGRKPIFILKKKIYFQ